MGASFNLTVIILFLSFVRFTLFLLFFRVFGFDVSNCTELRIFIRFYSVFY